MAFVFLEKRKINQIDTKNIVPSPDAYQIPHQKIRRDCAPFKTTSRRKMDFLQNSSIIPGPGSYDISKQLVEQPIITLVNNQAILVKLISQGSSSFLSQTKRFQSSYSPKPKYLPVQTTHQTNPQNSLKQKNKYKQARNKLHKTKLVQSSLPSIPSKSRGLLDAKSLLQKAKINKIEAPGPSNYTITDKRQINSKGAVWGKDKTERSQMLLYNNKNGPGQYIFQTEIRDECINQTAPFKSSTVRTFFDLLMYGSNKQEIVRERQKNKSKSPFPAPGQYNINSSSLKIKSPKPISNLSFQSSIQRFPTNSSIIQRHPQTALSYLTSQFSPPKSYNTINPPFNSFAKKQSSFLEQKQSNIPGPAYYQTKNPQYKKVHSIQSFGTTEQRGSITNLKVSQNVGPGSYNIEHIEADNRHNIMQESSIFKSKTKKISFINPSTSPSNAHYKLDHQDISTKLQKQKHHIENLKNIYVQKPPFESNHSRFPHYDIQQSKTQSTKKNQPFQPSPVIEKQFATISTIYKRKNGFGCAIGKSNRFVSQKKIGVPGVGEYQKTILEKNKSFNIRFNN